MATNWPKVRIASFVILIIAIACVFGGGNICVKVISEHSQTKEHSSYIYCTGLSVSPTEWMDSNIPQLKGQFFVVTASSIATLVLILLTPLHHAKGLSPKVEAYILAACVVIIMPCAALEFYLGIGLKHDIPLAPIPEGSGITMLVQSYIFAAVLYLISFIMEMVDTVHTYREGEEDMQKLIWTI